MLEEKDTCPVCKGPNIGYEFRTSKHTLFRCVECYLLFVPQLDQPPTGDSAIGFRGQSNEVSGPIPTEHRTEKYLHWLRR